MKTYSIEQLEELLEDSSITEELRTRIEIALKIGGDAIDALGEPFMNAMPASGDVMPELFGELGKLGIDVEELVDRDNRAAGTAIDDVVPIVCGFDFDFLNLKRRAVAFWACWYGHILVGCGLLWFLWRLIERSNETQDQRPRELEMTLASSKS